MNDKHHHAHHFSNLKAEADASKLGLWIFLCTEILMFGGLFVGYAIYNNLYPSLFLEGSKFLDWKLGSLNTVVLLFSSFTMALSIFYAQKNQLRLSTICLWVTFLCGVVFLGVKYIEYSHKIHDGLLPGKFFSHEGVENLGLYFSFYFVMTGLHGSHVIAGMLLIFWLIIRSHKKHFRPGYVFPLECVGLFWHLVDLIWIYLFPLLYLVE